MKRNIILAALVCLSITAFAQLKSPEDFLGYKIGTRFTPHHQIVAYFNHVAANSNLVRLQYYGETYEHRPLLVAFVANEQNIGQLENIRKDNIALTNQQTAATTNKPAIVWLSYNVHGNEPTSSEASMQTLFELVSPANAQTKKWLQNIVVVIDPCLNPDGRDRYVNWFNSVAGKNANPQPFAREHREPWPQGRTNHYNFDLNRDWAWQTQKESQQRVALYNQWLPQVHVDFHEQGFNAPYYFAPAAQPYHEVLTKWQHDFQVIIGKNNARYFDANHWLYFTKERFDLFYPSYGDTYPLYNGSIGMTYEQGGIGGGLSVINEDSDTLTLVDRVAHHKTTGLSTIEVSSQHAAELVSHFKDYFHDGQITKKSLYKSFVLKYSPEDAQRIDALKELLRKNGIRYGQASGSGSGFNYHSKKEESFSINNKDVVVPMAQPKATMVQVLFEPESKLSDSLTYDITAWALPYVYGLKAYATKADIKISEEQPAAKITNPVADPYGYIYPWGGMQSAKALSQLLQVGVKARFTETPLTLSGQAFPAGSIIILKTSNQKLGDNLWQIVRDIADKNNIQLTAAATGMVDAGLDFGSGNVHSIKRPNVVLLSGSDISSSAAGEVWSFFDNILDYPITVINASDLGRMDWGNTDVLIMPSGNYGFLKNKTQNDQLITWVKNGGKIIALEDAVAQLSEQDWCTLKSKETKDSSTGNEPTGISSFANRERNYISETTPGAIFKVNVDNTHPLLFGYPNYYYTLKLDGNVYKPIEGAGWNAGVIKEDRQLAGFVGNRLGKKLKNGVLFATQYMGQGQIVYLADNVLFRNFWYNGQLIMANALFF
ncbi:MAG: M14 family metallopeptidase [Niabella sp.]